jgi:predicted 2-oxoglutarate/Fe(II)-dependent dioxygenase YbiX/peroxiredoxin
MTATPAPDTKLSYRNLLPGDAAPWFRQRSTGRPNFVFDTCAGRYILLCFYGSAGDSAGRAALEAIEAHRDMFDDARASFFGVSIDRNDLLEGRLQEQVPGIRHFLDFDCSVSQLYGAAPTAIPAEAANVRMRRFWAVLDPALRVRAIFPFEPGGTEVPRVMVYMRDLPPVERYLGFEIPAPVLILPDVFEADLCDTLIDLYQRHGGEVSGFMQEVDGKTIMVHDHNFKSRRDYHVTDDDLVRRIQSRIMRRVAPEIEKVHFFKPTRMERYVVSCYAAEEKGHFDPHRDNTTAGTAHRRFAVSINLNSDFDGGEVGFPEYGPRRYKAPRGGAVIFSCPLLHAVSPVTRGKRYAFLPFLYDEAAARTREQNSHLVAGEGGAYKA